MTRKPTAEDDDPLGAIAAEEEGESGLLSAAEIAEAKAEARARWMKDAKAKAKKELMDIELLRLQREEGQKTGAYDKDEPCWITIDLPEYAASLVINSEPFHHTHSYQRPRHVVETLREMMFRAWNHQDDVEGKSISQKMGRRRVSSGEYLKRHMTDDPRFHVGAAA